MEAVPSRDDEGTGDKTLSNGHDGLPQWVSIALASLSGAVIATATLIRLAFTFNNRLQRIENQDLNQIIDARIAADWDDRRMMLLSSLIAAGVSKDWHDVRGPWLQVTVLAPLDKISDEIKQQGQNIAVLLERDRTAQALERIADSIKSRGREDP